LTNAFYMHQEDHEIEFETEEIEFEFDD